MGGWVDTLIIVFLQVLPFEFLTLKLLLNNELDFLMDLDQNLDQDLDLDLELS